MLETATRRIERRTGMVWIGLGRGSWPLSHDIRRDVPDPVLEVAVLRDPYGRRGRDGVIFGREGSRGGAV